MDDARTLQFGYLWILTALSGRQRGFRPIRTRVVLVRRRGRGRQSRRGRRICARLVEPSAGGVLAAYEADGRPVVAGLSAVVDVLDTLEADTARDQGVDVARCPGNGVGPWPVRYEIRIEDGQTLLLLAQLLDFDAGPRVLERSGWLRLHPGSSEPAPTVVPDTVTVWPGLSRREDRLQCWRPAGAAT